MSSNPRPSTIARGRPRWVLAVSATAMAFVMLAPAAAPVRAAVGLGVAGVDCGYDEATNTLRPIVAIERSSLADPTDSRASVALRLFDTDQPAVQLAQLATGVTDDGVEANGAFNVPLGSARSFTPEGGAVFGDGDLGGAALIADHGYQLVARVFDFSSVEELVVDVGTCQTSPEDVSIDTDEDGLTDDEEINVYGTDPLLKDTDGDELQDGHEVLGYDANADEIVDVDLPAIGTDPRRTDILVEIDSMVGDHSDGPFPESILIVQQSFANSPWVNYDGSTGINLHVDFGSTAPLLGGGTWGSLSGANAVAHVDVLGSQGGADYSWTDFNTIETANLAPARRELFHYNLWAHGLPPIPGQGAPLGRSRTIPSSAFVVALGAWTRTPGSDAAIFMHELGHNLGLMHGGFENQNGKPNYPSVMNYLYTTTGALVGGHNVVDYSRSALPALAESSLDEGAGLVAAGYGARWVGPGGVALVDADGGAVDWDNDGIIEPAVAVDLNAGAGDNPGLSLIQGHDDWSALVFDGGAVGDFAGTNVPPTSTPADDEPTVEQQEGLPPWPDSNVSPQAQDQVTSVDVGEAVDITLDAFDDDGDPLTYAIVAGPTHGSLDVCSTGSCIYTPDAGFVGTDTFTWTANDGVSDSNVATFTIIVSAVTLTTVGNDAAGAAALAAAMVREPAQLTGAAFVTVPASGTPHGTSVALDDFPTNGSTFAVLTSGDASLADDANTSPGSGVDLNGPNVRGDSDFDVTVLRLDLMAPAGANCLRLDLAFYSEEYPEFVGSYNDAFIAELDGSTWSTSGQDITAPDNFAFDATGDVISVNSSGATSMSAADAAGTTYDGATVLLRAGTQVAPGSHSLYLSIFDQGDGILDSAVFLDHVRFVTVQDPSVDCAEGAEIPTNDPPVAVDDATSTAFETPINVAVLGNDSDPDGDALTVTNASDPTNGTTSINPDGTVHYTPDAGFSGSDTFTYEISDGHGGTDTATVTVTVEPDNANPPPTSNAGADKGGTEGSAISLDGTVTNEPGTDTVSQTWSYALGGGTDAGMTCAFANASAVDTTITCTDDGAVSVKLTVSDGINPPVEDTAVLTIANADPAVSITSPSDGSTVNVGATVNVTAAWGDAGSNDSHTCSIDWGDGTITTGALTATTCSGGHAYASIGAPAVGVTITDDDGGSAFDEILLVVAEGGTKVTGGGWIARADGKLRFGLVADPAGGTAEGEIQVRWGTHRFHGTTVSGLTASRPSASWSGVGRYDGSDGYSYEVTVVDNGSGGGRSRTPDTFAIVIRDGGGTIVFNASGPLGGGNIKIH